MAKEKKVVASSADTVKMSRVELETIMTLVNTPLHGSDARTRNRFIELTGKEYHEIFPKRQAILEEASDKDENGKAKIENGMYAIPVDKQEETQAKVKAFLEEKIAYVLDKKSKPIFVGIRSILEKNAKPMSIGEGKIYDEVMTELESI